MPGLWYEAPAMNHPTVPEATVADRLEPQPSQAACGPAHLPTATAAATALLPGASVRVPAPAATPTGNGATRRRLLHAVLAGAALVALPPRVCAAGAADAPRFGLGVASGRPQSDRLVLWTRLTGADLPPAVAVRWELADDEAFTRVVARGTEAAETAWAHSVHAEPAGLTPGRWYWYRFEALGQRSAVGRTRTAPAADAAATLRFSIASCQRFDKGHYAAWRDVAESAPDLVLFLGDYIYESASAPGALRPHEGGLVRTLDGYRRRHAQYKADPLLQAAHACAPWLVIWDDHEVDNDYAGLTGQRLQPGFKAQRAAAYQAWWEHMPLPKSVRPVGADARIVFRLDWGRLARLHGVDMRQHRDPQACPRPGRSGGRLLPRAECAAFDDPQRTLLGAAQEQWLAAGWDLERPWNLLAQTTLMTRLSASPTADEGGTYRSDGWDGYAPARRRLLAAVAERRLPGAVVLGGDVHMHCVAQLKTDFDDPRGAIVASEFCGTSISSHGTAQALVTLAQWHNPDLLLADSTQRGTIRFTLDEHRLQAELRAVDNPSDPASPVRTMARYAVEAGRPGPVAA